MASKYYPTGSRTFVKVVNVQGVLVMRLGHMVAFLVRALVSIPLTLRHYRKEFSPDSVRCDLG